MATTLNLAIAAGADDAREEDDGSSFNGTASTVDVTSFTDPTTRFHSGFRYDGVTIPAGATIDTATFTPYFNTGTWDDMNGIFGCEDADDPANFVDNADVTTRVGTITTATVAWIADGIGVGFTALPGDFKAPIQEIVDRGGWASGQAIVVLGKGNDAALKRARLTANEGGQNAKLDITYSVAGGIVVLRRRHEGY